MPNPYPPPPTTKPIPSQRMGPYKPTLILHGGAGSITRSSLPPTLYAKYHASLQSYLLSTATLLHTGSSAISAACHAIMQMEDDPLFNCGRGSVFTSAGEVEMEASIAVTSLTEDVEFEGKIKRSAAVSMVTATRHPILLAREVLSMGEAEGGLGGVGSMHGHLSGKEVEEWGWKCRGLERMSKEWFWTRRRWEEHLRGLKRQMVEGQPGTSWTERHEDMEFLSEDVFVGLEDVLVLPSQGTVGAVCMDSWGVIAVATSTGGLTNKKPGRIGDTPSVGAGFWAETWAEKIQQGLKQEEDKVSANSKQQSVAGRIAALAKSEMEFWLGDCLAVRERWNANHHRNSPALAEHLAVEKQPLVRSKNTSVSIEPTTRRRAIAMSGTGNGDSFLRTNACRTAAAISRFSSLSLQEALYAVAGPDGELQRSARGRWGETGEGEGGIIGIELVESTHSREGKAIFDFNCGGLWRAYFEKDAKGEEKPKVMVFREEY